MVKRTGPRRAVIYTALAVSLAVILFVLLEWVQGASLPFLARAQNAVPDVAVIEATRDIQINEPITASMLRIVQIPQGSPIGPTPVLESDLAQVERSTARAPIFAGEVIQRTRLYGPGLALSTTPDAVFLTKGYALYTLPTGHLEMPLSGLAAGDYVEVLAALAPESSGGADTTQVLTATVQPVDPHALVTYVQPNQAALTLAVPKGELPYLAWLTGHGAAFSFAQVRPDDPHSDMVGVTLHQFQEYYHVPHQ